MSSKLITPESPLLIPPMLAAEIGLESAVILQQIHYFCQRSKHLLDDGKHWFYLTLDGWAKKLPFFFFTMSAIRRAIANLKKLELIDVCRHSRETWYQSNWYTVNVENVKALWNRICQNQQIDLLESDTSIYSQEANYINTDFSTETFSPKEAASEEKEAMQLITEQDNKQQLTETNYVEEPVQDASSNKLNSSQDNSSAALSRQNLEILKPKANKQARDKEVWEIAPGMPYPVFVNWRADSKYKPQGGKWENDAHGNAYSEFYNNRSKTTAVLFPQFMEYLSTCTKNCHQQLSADMKALLPSCFVTCPEATEENVQQLMNNVQQLVAMGVEVALPQGIATPSCSQSMSFAQAQETTSISPLKNLPKNNEQSSQIEAVIRYLETGNEPAARAIALRHNIDIQEMLQRLPHRQLQVLVD